ncbi:hypothetical protein Drorol1_Dr00021258 [Drosera rotundifolia]
MRMCRLSNTLFFIVLTISYMNVSYGEVKENPLTAKASLIRYWNRRISNGLPRPAFLLSKASPLNAVDTAILTKLASESALSRHLSRFCSSANLFCSFDAKQRNNDRRQEKHEEDVDFSSYNGKQFDNYGLSGLGGMDTFKNYSNGINMPIDSFIRYSPASTGHSEQFKGYASNANIGSDTFTNYDQGATGGSGGFSSYQPNVNVPNVKFASYDSDGNSHDLSFATYSDDTNSGTESFISYGKNGNGVPVEFSNYASTSNIVGSKFTGYSELGNGANDTFKGYSSNANNPNNNFKARQRNVSRQ